MAVSTAESTSEAVLGPVSRQVSLKWGDLLGLLVGKSSVNLDGIAETGE